MSCKIPIYRMGWRDAKKIIDTGGRLSRFHNGHAEIIGPVVEKIRYGLHLCPLVSREGGECEGYLTKHSVEILEENLHQGRIANG